MVIELWILGELDDRKTGIGRHYDYLSYLVRSSGKEFQKRQQYPLTYFLPSDERIARICSSRHCGASRSKTILSPTVLSTFMTLNIIDPAFLFPGISLLFLAFTNRYLTLAGIIRQLNIFIDEEEDANRIQQIEALRLRIVLIKYMQACGVIAFLCCVFSMLAIFSESQTIAKIMFLSSLLFMVIALTLSLIEILKSGEALKIELDRTNRQKDV